jgi:hypothetical protein
VRTAIIQSYRTTRVEPWMQRCMQSVRDWANSHGYVYEFVDDGLFDFLPAHIRNNSLVPLLPKTDIARLGLLHNRLAHDYERVVWLDADVLVFDPASFTLPENCGAMFCHEVWTSLGENGELIHHRGINNALMIFERGHPLLDFLRYATVELYEQSDPARISTLALGTALLSKLGRVVPLRLHTQVACISPLLLGAAYRADHPEWLREHALQHGHRFCAANLCRSLLAGPSNRQRSRSLDDDQMLALVEQLMATRGSVLLGDTVDA